MSYPDDYLIDSELYPFTEKEKSLYLELDQLADIVKDNCSIDLFELPEEFADENLDPESAHFGFMLGVDFFTQAVFENLIEIIRQAETEVSQEQVLH